MFTTFRGSKFHCFTVCEIKELLKQLTRPYIGLKCMSLHLVISGMMHFGRNVYPQQILCKSFSMANSRGSERLCNCSSFAICPELTLWFHLFIFLVLIKFKPNNKNTYGGTE